LEIVKERSGGFLHLRLSGRLDHHWSQPLDDALEEVLREGARHLRLDLSGVSYLSSAGAGVLLKGYRDAAALQGSFQISEASDRVRNALRLMALEDVFFGPGGDITRRRTLSVPLPLGSERASYESRALDAGRSLCYLAGDPARLSQAPYDDEHSVSVTIHKDLFALGVGALGSSYDECRGFFGEFIAAAGGAAFMPTDGTSTPDYMLSSGALVPEVQALYAVVFRGSPSHQLRFEASTPSAAVPLSDIVQACASLAGTSDVGIVMAAEVAGLVCARLRRSPAQSGGARFDFPAVREWLSFTPEREYARFSSLVVGVASTSPSATMRPFLRPVSDEFSHEFYGHFHAAVTAFRSLPRGKLEIADVVAESFQPRSVFSVVHLLRDARPIEGAGESEFQRGACWVFPIASPNDQGGEP
jgi:anti-anti-sigma factor